MAPPSQRESNEPVFVRTCLAMVEKRVFWHRWVAIVIPPRRPLPFLLPNARMSDDQAAIFSKLIVSSLLLDMLLEEVSGTTNRASQSHSTSLPLLDIRFLICFVTPEILPYTPLHEHTWLDHGSHHGLFEDTPVGCTRECYGGGIKDV